MRAIPEHIRWYERNYQRGCWRLSGPNAAWMSPAQVCSGGSMMLQVGTAKEPPDTSQTSILGEKLRLLGTDIVTKAMIAKSHTQQQQQQQGAVSI